MKVPKVAVVTVGALMVAAVAGGAVLTSDTGDDVNSHPRQEATAAGFAPPGTAAAAQDARTASMRREVTLLTGDRVRVDAHGAELTGATSGPGSSAFLEFGSNGDHYRIPDVALPYLGTTLDLELFNVSALARLENPDSPTLAVTIDESQAGSAQQLPAVAVTGTTDTTGTTATATIDKAQAHQLGALLAEQFEASSTGRSATPPGQLPGISRISLAETPTAGGPGSMRHAGPPADRPLRFHTLTLQFIGHDGGAPALGTFGTAGFVQNLDDHRLSPGFQLIPAGQGELRLSVPEGTYSAVFGITRPNARTPGQHDGALVAEPEFTVDSDRTITLDARTAVPFQAVLDPSVTPPPVRWDRLHFARTSAPGEGFTSGSVLVAPVYMGLGARTVAGTQGKTLAATPTSSAVTKGAFGFRATTSFNSGNEGQTPETQSMYVLDFPHPDGIPAALNYTVDESELTTVRNQIHRAPGGHYRWENPILETAVIFHTEGLALGAGFNTYVPAGERTDYWYSAAPEHSVWQQQVDDPAAEYFGIEATVGAPRRIQPGEEIHQVWNKGPDVPSPAALTGLNTGEGGPLDVWSTWCVACRQDDNGAVFLLPNGDSDPSHAGSYQDHYSLGGRVSQLDFYRNGELALSGDANGTVSSHSHLNPTDLYLPLLPTPASYRLDWTVADKLDLAVHTATRWTFHSERGDPAAELPDGMQCAPDASRSCSFLPLLFVTYDLALDYLSRAPAGRPFEIAFTVGHQQGQAPPRGVTATVSASYDGGTTWSQPRAATAGPDGTFTTTVEHPPLAGTNGYVALRVQATDADGNTVDQTITRAYALTE
jgi:hypothetical protein